MGDGGFSSRSLYVDKVLDRLGLGAAACGWADVLTPEAFLGPRPGTGTGSAESNSGGGGPGRLVRNKTSRSFALIWSPCLLDPF